MNTNCSRSLATSSFRVALSGVRHSARSILRGGLSGTSTMEASLDCDMSAYSEMMPRGSLAAALTVPVHSEEKLPLALAGAREQ